MSASLPIDSLRADFDKAWSRGPVVVAAATGSGKSTRLPLWMGEQGPVLVIQPRRVACTALAAWLAEQVGEAVGESIGYAIRFEQKVSAHTGICFVTPGIALRWLVEGRLGSFESVLLDEFHERRWDTDLLLALLRDQGRHRLVVTSATLAGQRVAKWLKGALLEAEGKQYPVSVRYLAAQERDMPTQRELATRVRQAVRAAMDETDGDVLVFLPGRGEISDCHQALSGLSAERVVLHAGVSPAEQQGALRSGRNRRVILATNVAETSLTIPGVTAVVDSGLERRTARRNQRTVLQLAPIAQANAEQRRGRAGRVAPGLCLRLWGRQAPLEAFTPPQVQREDLSEMMLAAASAGYRLEALDFPDPLPEKSLSVARERLEAMAAVDEAGRVTAHGSGLFELPIDSHFAHLITAMPDAASRAAMADLTAALSTRPRLFRLPDSETGRRQVAEWQSQPCDAITLLMALRASGSELPGCHPAARRDARRLAVQLRRVLGLPEAIPETLEVDRSVWLKAVMQAAPALVHVRREKRRQAMGNGEGEILVDERSRLQESAEAALVFDDHSVPGRRGTRETRTIGTCLAPLPLDWLLSAGLCESRLGPATVDGGRPRVVEAHYYANRLISRTEREPAAREVPRVLARLILAGRMLSPVGEQLLEDLARWELYQALIRAGEDPGGWLEAPQPQERQPVPSAEDWLCERLATLGVESVDDLELLAPEDLRFDGLPDWAQTDFDQRFPRRFSLGDLELSLEYDPDRKQITLVRQGGTRRAPPKRWELPSWTGWRLRYREGNRITDIR
ncbi:helicase-related protein [Gammaproteobacteria bacterium AB-CW1]|uniref:Helicase-related protein n=1 Tax=Natronospira elongata TaxID=3110268 RepID=A0AAP6JEH1_9GAMM|nr:helicase-related protein [Gammaproteobacteria bacterium AB-CW1]